MMTAILVDSNVLLDLMTEDTRWLAWSAEAVEKAADRFRLEEAVDRLRQAVPRDLGSRSRSLI
jgi:carbamoylphosphate synthase large subunit